MNKSDLAQVLEVSESYLNSQEKRILENRRKYGIEIKKIGHGRTAQYGIRFPWMDEMVWGIDEVEIR